MLLAMLPVSALELDELIISNGIQDTDYTYLGDILTIISDEQMTISSVNITSDKIVVQSGITANITLNNVIIDTSASPDTCAFDMTGATVNLTLLGNNIFKSGDNKAGFQAPNGATLNINGSGSLNATGGLRAAGIGGGETQDAGIITINGGTINATSGLYSAGMGG